MHELHAAEGCLQLCHTDFSDGIPNLVDCGLSCSGELGDTYLGIEFGVVQTIAAGCRGMNITSLVAWYI